MTKVLNKKRFFKWAREHQHEKIVTGKSIYTSGPIARFLNHETGGRTETDMEEYKINGKWRTLPDWAWDVTYLALNVPGTLGDLLAELRRQGVRP